MLEVARSYGELLKTGWKPRRVRVSAIELGGFNTFLLVGHYLLQLGW
jgi:hypothetical protein